MTDDTRFPRRCDSHLSPRCRRKQALPAVLVPLLFLVTTMASVVPAHAADPAGDWYFTLYLQESFPKQTATNAQIKSINDTFGTSFEDWSDVHTLNLGLQLFRKVSPHWKVGVQVDYSRGSIGGTQSVTTDSGPANLYFSQEYGTYADLYLMAHFLPCPKCVTVIPFIYGGGGIAYEKDTTTLHLYNNRLDSGLSVANSGSFPTFSIGAGIDCHLFPRRSWYLELGAAYVWARFKNTVPASGDLLPISTIQVDTDLTGPNYWIGVGTRF